jgi:hypothetical protein
MNRAFYYILLVLFISQPSASMASTCTTKDKEHKDAEIISRIAAAVARNAVLSSLKKSEEELKEKIKSIINEFNGARIRIEPEELDRWAKEFSIVEFFGKKYDFPVEEQYLYLNGIYTHKARYFCKMVTSICIDRPCPPPKELCLLPKDFTPGFNIIDESTPFYLRKRRNYIQEVHNLDVFWPNEYKLEGREKIFKRDKLINVIDGAMRKISSLPPEVRREVVDALIPIIEDIGIGWDDNPCRQPEAKVKSTFPPSIYYLRSSGLGQMGTTESKPQEKIVSCDSPTYRECKILVSIDPYTERFFANSISTFTFEGKAWLKNILKTPEPSGKDTIKIQIPNSAVE